MGLRRLQGGNVVSVQAARDWGGDHGARVQVTLGQGVAFLTAMDTRAGRVGFEGLGAGLAFLEG